MKKYKLIKTYPGSPELGTIASYSEEHNAIEFESTEGEIHYFSSLKDNIFETIIVSNPEFWEEVVEKEYEILSLSLMRSIRDEIIITTDYSDKYIEGLLACKGNSIHSVKRLSDGEVFTIGDKVTERLSNNRNVIIKSICIHLNKTVITVNKGSFNTTVCLSLLDKSKQPLFISEDGIEIYKGDTVYCFNNDYSITEFHNIQWKLARRIFSTKEAAEEYLLMNKPCLSINDFLLNKDTSFNALVVTTLSRLRELAKSKLYESKN